MVLDFEIEFGTGVENWGKTNLVTIQNTHILNTVWIKIPKASILKRIVPTVIRIVNRKVKTPCRDSALTGQLYFDEIMATYSHERFNGVARMNRETFLSLLEALKQAGLVDGRKVCAG